MNKCSSNCLLQLRLTKTHSMITYKVSQLRWRDPQCRGVTRAPLSCAPKWRCLFIHNNFLGTICITTSIVVVLRTVRLRQPLANKTINTETRTFSVTDLLSRMQYVFEVLKVKATPTKNLVSCPELSAEFWRGRALHNYNYPLLWICNVYFPDKYCTQMALWLDDIN